MMQQNNEQSTAQALITRTMCTFCDLRNDDIVKGALSVSSLGGASFVGTADGASVGTALGEGVRCTGALVVG